MKRMKERDRETEKSPQPDKAEVICPLILSLTHLAVNYDLTWQPETKITVEDDQGFTQAEVTGVWKSNPVQRGHTGAFQDELKRMRAAEEVSWDEKAYYFTHEEGVEARKAYENLVLAGKLKAHITSWGPNPKKANDKSRFHKFTGVTFQELQEKYPELYASKAGTVSEDVPAPKEEVAVEPETKETTSGVEVEPTEENLEEIREEERVAAATATEDVLEDLEITDQDDEDDHDVIPLYVPSDLQAERIDSRSESIAWKLDGQEHTSFLMELPEVGKEMWLEIGKHTIDGVTYEIRLED